MKILKLIMNYFSQSSTYKGLFAVLAACGVVVSPDLSNAIVACALGVTGLFDVLVNEKPEKEKNLSEKNL